MNKDEFIDYVESFNMLPGTFSNEQLLEIGRVFKYQVMPKDKNWSWLTERLGVHKSPNAFRMWISRNVSFDDSNKNDVPTTEEKISLIDGRKVDSNYDIRAQIENLYKEQRKTRDLNNSYRRALTDEARIEVLKQSMTDAVDLIEALPPYVKPVSFEDDNHECYVTDTEAVLLLSDLHLGVEVSNFYNKYNIEIARTRLEKLAKEVIWYCRLNNVKRLTIVNLGDMIQGLIHITGRIEEQTDVVNQIMIAAEFVSRTLCTLQDAAPEVIYRSCTDNHSRAVANYKENIEKENFSKLIDWFLRERLKDSKIIFKQDNLDDSLGKFSLLNGKKVVFAHGHLDNINTCMQNMVGATKEFIDYILLGHYHVPKEKSYQGCTVFVNGSIVGTEQYALSKRLFTEPSQKLIIVHDDNLLDINIGLN